MPLITNLPAGRPAVLLEACTFVCVWLITGGSSFPKLGAELPFLLSKKSEGNLQQKDDVSIKQSLVFHLSSHLLKST